MLHWFKRQSVAVLCILGFISPFLGMSLIDYFYFSSVCGWILGFCCFVCAYIIVCKRPEEDDDTHTQPESIH